MHLPVERRTKLGDEIGFDQQRFHLALRKSDDSGNPMRPRPEQQGGIARLAEVTEDAGANILRLPDVEQFARAVVEGIGAATGGKQLRPPGLLN